jgi:hypothetical protein
MHDNQFESVGVPRWGWQRLRGAVGELEQNAIGLVAIKIRGRSAFGLFFRAAGLGQPGNAMV